MKKFFLFCAVLFSLNFISCEYGLEEAFYRIDEVKTRSKSILDLGNDTDSLNKGVEVPSVSSSKFSVLLFTDIHFGKNKKGENCRYDDEFFSYFEAHKTELETYDSSSYPFAFAVSGGDNVEHGYQSEYHLYNDFCSKIETKFGLKTYSVVGNHDLFNSGWKYYKNFCYPYVSSYFFKTSYGENAIDWIFLDSGNGTLGHNQLSSLKDVLKSSSRKKIVVSHYPIYAGGAFYFTMQNLTERDTLIADFCRSNVSLLADGHRHSGGQWDFSSYFHEENVKSFLDYTTFAVIYVDLNANSVNIVSVDYLND